MRAHEFITFESNMDNPAFKRWFSGSVTHDNGKPKVFYHATNKGDKDDPLGFDIFDTNRWDSLGAHFGSLDQATNIFDKSVKYHGHSNHRIYPVHLSLKNPLRLEDHHGEWFPNDILEQLLHKKLISTKIHDRISTCIRNQSDGGLNTIRQLIRDMGYDSIVYLNRFEGFGPVEDNYDRSSLTDAQFQKKYPGAHDSYIALKSSQIKSSIGNCGLYDPDRESIVKEMSIHRIHEISFANDVGEIDNEKQIIDHSTVDGTISKKDVYFFDNGDMQLYYLTDDMVTIKAWVMLRRNNLLAMKSYSKGLMRALMHYLIDIKHIRLEVKSTDQLTDDGLKWILTQINHPSGFKITDQNNKPIDPTTLEKEWHDSWDTGLNGPTGIFIGESILSEKLRILEESPVRLDRFGVYQTRKQFIEFCATDNKFPKNKELNF